MASYRNQLLKNGSPIAGVAARLYNEENQKIGADTTTYDGRYSFTDIPAGNYEVRFFGEDFTSDSWFNITVTGPGGELPVIVFSGTPTVSVLETSYEYEQQGEISVAQIYLTNLEVSAGKIATVAVKFKKSNDSTWDILSKFDFDKTIDGVTDDLSSAIFVSDIPLKEKPSIYDFKVSFFNGDGIPAKNSGVLVTADYNNITFNGIPDVAEYVGVEGVTIKNSNSAGDKIPTNIIMLEWDHPAITGPGTFTDGAGKPIEVNGDQVKNISGFVVYMFISNDGKDPDAGLYPVSNPTNGTWYLLDTIAPDITFANIRLPQKKEVIIWIGFTTPGVVTSATSEFLKF